MRFLQKIIDRTLTPEQINRRFIDCACLGYPRMVRFLGRHGADLHARIRHLGNIQTVGHHAINEASTFGRRETLGVIIDDLGYNPKSILASGIESADTCAELAQIALDNGLRCSVEHMWGEIALNLVNHKAGPSKLTKPSLEHAQANGDDLLKRAVSSLPPPIPSSIQRVAYVS